jgi:hypothetical protein
LVKELVALKREGFQPSSTPVVPTPMRELPPSVQAAVNAWAEAGPAEVARQTRLAWLLLDQGNTPEQVAATIGDGVELPL